MKYIYENEKLKKRIDFLESKEYGEPIFKMGYNKGYDDAKKGIRRKS